MASDPKDTETVIIGAGLSGLATAVLLTEAGRSVRIVEARNSPGGRIRSLFDKDSGDYLADLGPTWIWPAYQPLISRWIEKLDLDVFPQYETGNAIIDNGTDNGPLTAFLPGQDGSVRIKGGSQALIDRMVALLPENTVSTASPAKSVSTNGGCMLVQIGNSEETVLTCEQIVVATPPRIALNTICWELELSSSFTAALDMMPTWMAPHAKVVVLYDTAFWRERGLSGRIASQAGPIVEGHDHSGPDGSPAAIFGFIGWPPAVRAQVGKDLESHIRSQMRRCFGADCPEPRSIHIEDWATDPHVTSPRDLTEPMSHPGVGPEILRAPQADGRLWFAGAETATRSPGLIEGAFDAAMNTAAKVCGVVVSASWYKAIPQGR